MKYISIDIETTGIDNQKNQLIQFAAVIDDTIIRKPLDELPRLLCYVAHPNYNINSGLAAKEDDFHTLETIRKISEFQHSKDVPQPVYGGAGAKNTKNEIYTTSKDLGKLFARWLDEQGFPKNETGKFFITPAGKNVAGFDIPFFKNTVNDWYSHFSFSHRVLDPSILYFNPFQDEYLPDLSECKKRAGLSEKVAHDALEDSLDVIQLLRLHFDKKWK